MNNLSKSQTKKMRNFALLKSVESIEKKPKLRSCLSTHKVLRKSATRSIFQSYGEQDARKTKKKTPSHKKEKIKISKDKTKRKSMMVARDQYADNAYYPEDGLKSEKVKTSCILSTQSKDSFGRLLSTRYNLDSSRTLSRHNSRPAISEHYESQGSLRDLLERARKVLHQYRSKCGALQKSNQRLKRELAQAKLFQK